MAAPRFSVLASCAESSGASVRALGIVDRVRAPSLRSGECAPPRGPTRHTHVCVASGGPSPLDCGGPTMLLSSASSCLSLSGRWWCGMQSSRGVCAVVATLHAIVFNSPSPKPPARCVVELPQERGCAFTKTSLPRMDMHANSSLHRPCKSATADQLLFHMTDPSLEVEDENGRVSTLFIKALLYATRAAELPPLREGDVVLLHNVKVRPDAMTDRASDVLDHYLLGSRGRWGCVAWPCRDPGRPSDEPRRPKFEGGVCLQPTAAERELLAALDAHGARGQPPAGQALPLPAESAHAWGPTDGNHSKRRCIAPSMQHSTTETPQAIAVLPPAAQQQRPTAHAASDGEPAPVWAAERPSAGSLLPPLTTTTNGAPADAADLNSSDVRLGVGEAGGCVTADGSRSGDPGVGGSASASGRQLDVGGTSGDPAATQAAGAERGGARGGPAAAPQAEGVVRIAELRPASGLRVGVVGKLLGWADDPAAAGAPRASTAFIWDGTTAVEGGRDQREVHLRFWAGIEAAALPMRRCDAQRVREASPGLGTGTVVPVRFLTWPPASQPGFQTNVLGQWVELRCVAAVMFDGQVQLLFDSSSSARIAEVQLPPPR